MTRITQSLATVLFSAVLIAGTAGLALASTKGSGSHGDKMSSGMKSDNVAIDGYCPVCIAKGKYMKGESNYSMNYNGKTYYFVGEKQLEAFQEDPEKYLEGLESKYEDLRKEAMKAGESMKQGSGKMKKGSY